MGSPGLPQIGVRLVSDNVAGSTMQVNGQTDAIRCREGRASLRQRLGSVLAVLLALVLVCGALSSGVHAQSCTADFQCPNGGLSRSYCAGNVLVTTRSVCAGTCRTVEESRIPCPGPCAGDRCIGGPLGSAREPGRENDRCVPRCVCRNKVLTLRKPPADPRAPCERTVIQCENGCSCYPEVKCR